MSGIQKIKDTISLFFIFFTFCSTADSPFPAAPPCFPEVFAPDFACSSFTAAPYPASSTALMISAVSSLFSSNSTCMLFVSRFTLTFSTPASLPTLFSTWEEQAEQVIPVTSNLSFIGLSFLLS